MEGAKKPKRRLKRQRNNVPVKLELEVEENESSKSNQEPKGESEETQNQSAAKKLNWEPQDWSTVLDNIQKMRSGKDAPVDTMGCERCAQTDVEPPVYRFQTLVALMLSSQTKDQVTYAAMERLKQKGLTVGTILTIGESELGQLIKPVGFWKKKAIYIKETAEILRDKYKDDIPKTIPDLCSLPGVGPKMAYITMSAAWNKAAGIGVDTHVHRISNRLKWVGEKETKTPEKTREALESWLPPELWQEINILLVGFGQTICLPLTPKCSKCLNNKLCPFGKSNPKTQESHSSKKESTGEDEKSEYF